MAKKRTTKKAGTKKKPKMDFHTQTVLFRWAIGKLGVESLAQFRERFQIGPDTTEGIDPQTGLHHFHEQIARSLPATSGAVLGVDQLREYENNILAHTQTINRSRHQHGQMMIAWKYHQYLALLFTEIFLDRYFEDAAGLRREINGVIQQHNEALADDKHPDWVAPFPEQATTSDDGNPKRQLARLAFWCATGSGKTLLMHMHIRQYQQYRERASKRGLWPPLGQVILVTPNDGLSEQHALELKRSGFGALIAGEVDMDGLFASHAKHDVKIVAISKVMTESELEDRRAGGKKFETSGLIAEDAEGSNLVLVDEGHRGASSSSKDGDGTWFERRKQLAAGGFTIEYSATFKEAVVGDEEMRHRYARSILLDYSYQSFYRDGYGKDFAIFNYADEKKHSEERQFRYLMMSLVLYYQQMRVWLDGGGEIKPFRIDKPLWVFVGHTVTGGKASRKDDKTSVSDVLEVLLFVREFLSDRKRSLNEIEHLLDQGMVDQNGREIFKQRLNCWKLTSGLDDVAKEIHEGILSDIFHASGGGPLTVQLLKEATGELALKVGDHDPFGVVNVGDPKSVAEKCEANKITLLEDDTNRSSLFRDINKPDSTINLLVGSRKFTEGWNSWRVSSIGLMNMGKGEGAQIIQLFGRGVRLRGYQFSLRRSAVLAQTPPKPKGLRHAETLQVFGVRAKYMQTFRDWILDEVPEALDREIWEIPTVHTLPKDRKLKTIRLKEEIDGERVERGQAFRKLGPLVRLRPPSSDGPDEWLRRYPVKLNWLPRIQGIASKDGNISGAIGRQVEQMPTQSLTQIPALFFDFDELLFGLEAFKATRGLDRLHVDKKAIVDLLGTSGWYELYASDEDMRLDRYENREQWQRMFQQLLNAYAEKFYSFMRRRWEAPYLEIADVDENDPNLIDQYSVETVGIDDPALQEQAREFVEELKDAMESGDVLLKSKIHSGTARSVPFGGHLYQPLLYVGKRSEIRISPVALNDGEAKFVEDLVLWCTENKREDIALLRNQSVTGLGFFQAANFYPDFLLWLEDGDQQHLVFLDPKGLTRHDKADAKIRFATEEIPRLQAIIDRKPDAPRLHAFILSTTAFSDLNWSTDDGTRYDAKHYEDLGVFDATGDHGYIARTIGRIGTELTGVGAE